MSVYGWILWTSKNKKNKTSQYVEKENFMYLIAFVFSIYY